MSANIHTTAIISEGAIIGEGCVIGPYCKIGSQVKLANNVTLMSHVVVEGDTFIDEGTTVFPFAVIGVICQDLKYKGEPTKIVIGKNNNIREHVTIHLATKDGGGITVIKDECLIMVGSHVAHDVMVGNRCIIGNNVLLAGHVILEDDVIISGGSAVHQFCRIGEGAFIGGLSGVGGDIVPYALFAGARDSGEINGVNMVGLKRKGFSLESIHEIRQCYDMIFDKNHPLQDNIIQVKKVFQGNEKISKIINFITSPKSRSLCTVYRNHKNK